MTVYTLFGQPASPASLTADTAAYTMGVQFSVSQAATLTAIWWFSPSGAGELPESISLFQVSGQSLVTSQVPSWSGAAGSGWVRAPFTVPPSLTAGVSYKACVTKQGGSNFYGSTAHYWDTGSGQNGITSGPMSAPNNAGGDGGQDTFNASSVLTYPATSFNATNYWVDAEISAAASGSGLFVTNTAVGENMSFPFTIVPPAGPAGGVLSGTYPNPGLANPLAVPGNLNLTAGNVDVQAAGSGLRVAEGANAKQGTAVLVAGTVTVANTSVTATSRIFLTSQADGGAPGFLRVSARTAGTSFTVTSSSGTDTSTFAYEIFEVG